MAEYSRDPSIRQFSEPKIWKDSGLDLAPGTLKIVIALIFFYSQSKITYIKYIK